MNRDLKSWLAVAGLTEGAVFRLMRREFITAAARNRADVFAIVAQSRLRSLDSVQNYVDADARFDDRRGLEMFQRRGATLWVRYAARR